MTLSTLRRLGLSILTKLLVRHPPEEAEPESGLECPHTILIPAWEVPEARRLAGALDFVCESCGMPFTANDSPAANQATIRHHV
jgi:hypothetical protein